MAEQGYIEPIVKVGNLKSMRTIADVRDVEPTTCLLQLIRKQANIIILVEQDQWK